MLCEPCVRSVTIAVVGQHIRPAWVLQLMHHSAGAVCVRCVFWPPKGLHMQCSGAL